MDLSRYYIVDYDERRIARLIAISRHVYDIIDDGSERFITSFVLKRKHDQVLVTNCCIGLTSFDDMMDFNVFKKLNFFKDKTII